LSLPFVLAGPILRRVEPNLVSVWIALSRPASITITLWQGRTKTGALDPLIRSDPVTKTTRIADQLHVTTALLRIPAGSIYHDLTGVMDGILLRTEELLRTESSERPLAPSTTGSSLRSAGGPPPASFAGGGRS